MNISEKTISALIKIINGERTGDLNYPLSPYKKGSDLVIFFNRFGWTDKYEAGFPSRNDYTKQKISEVINTDKLISIVEAAVDPRDYFDTTCDVEEAVNYLNQYLEHDGYQLIKEGLSYKIDELLTNRVRAGETIKNIIFASTGPKPEIVFDDALTNKIRVTENGEYCLFYDNEISKKNGISWNALVEWWRTLGSHSVSFEEAEQELYSRLLESIPKSSPPAQLLFESYFKFFIKNIGSNVPALIPEVYLHYDPYTLKDRKGKKNLDFERMDFLLLLPNNIRVVLEVDGKQHYTDEQEKGSPKRYAEMASEGRKLMLLGYEVFRFGGYELNERTGKDVVKDFFQKLFRKHSVLP